MILLAKRTLQKNTTLKQVELSNLVCVAYPNVDNLKRHAILMASIAKLNMHVVLVKKHNGTVTIEQFTPVFSVVLSENIDNILSN